MWQIAKLFINKALCGCKMKKLLYHSFDRRVDILEPRKYSCGCICLSEGVFLGYLGEYLYIFEHETLQKHFNLTSNPTTGAQAFSRVNFEQKRMYHFISDSIEKEFRIYEPIDIGRYAIGVVQNYNVLKGELLIKKLNNTVMSRERINL